MYDGSSPEVSRWCTVVFVELVKPPVPSSDIASNLGLEGNRVTAKAWWAGVSSGSLAVCPKSDAAFVLVVTFRLLFIN